MKYIITRTLSQHFSVLLPDTSVLSRAAGEDLLLYVPYTLFPRIVHIFFRNFHPYSIATRSIARAYTLFFFFQYREARKLSSSTWIETQIGYRTVHGISMSHPARITNHPPPLVAAAITLIAMLRDICLSSRAERERKREREPRPTRVRVRSPRGAE